MSKMFKRKATSSRDSTGNSGWPDPSKMTALTVPGVVERGQCVQCADGKNNLNVASSAGAISGGNAAVAVPTVKAVPIVVSRTAAPTENLGDARKSPPQSNTEIQINAEILRNGGSNTHGQLKQPPEEIVGVNDGSESSEYSSSGSEESDDSSYEDEKSLEDVPLLNLDLCQLESDHASSSLVNNLRFNDSGGMEFNLNEEDEDDRKPAAKTISENKPMAFSSSPMEQIDELSARTRKIQLEMADLDMACLESGNPSSNQAGNETLKTLICPSGMSPDVFYELPPEMQKEVIEQGSRSNSAISQNANDTAGCNRGSNAAATSAGTDIDPETLASLPDYIRKEVLEQARREQQSTNSAATNTVAVPPRQRTKRNDLSMSTTAFLNDCNIDAEDYENFPEEVKSDIMNEKTRRSVDENLEGEDGSINLNSSDFDPETLASLPEDVREEVLEEERRQRKKKRHSVKPSTVGAHSVNVPAGYDPDTFSALPEDIQKELLDDATRQAGTRRRFSADGYDYESIVDATVVQAGPMGQGDNVTSCTYEGEYNIIGKRHGDGELKWANGDKYVGKFKDGYIEGRGTIGFHDGTEYAGQWKKNRFHGEGTRRFNNGNVYTGNYTSGKRQGQGKCYFANGDMYVGDWKEDTIHGFGRYYYNNGHSFEGMFRNGKRNGRGKYQLTDGRVEIYRYVNDSRVGDGVRWSANRKKAWRMNNGKVTKKVSMEDATLIAKRCGLVVEES